MPFFCGGLFLVRLVVLFWCVVFVGVGVVSVAMRRRIIIESFLLFSHHTIVLVVDQTFLQSSGQHDRSRERRRRVSSYWGSIIASTFGAACKSQTLSRPFRLGHCRNWNTLLMMLLMVVMMMIKNDVVRFHLNCLFAGK